MAIYKPNLKTDSGVEEIQFPMSAIVGLEDALKQNEKITNLAGATCVLNNTIDLSAAFTYNVNFTDANGINYIGISVVRGWQEDDFVELFRYINEDGSYRLICDRWNGGDIRWLNEKAKTLTFTGGADVSNIDLVNYLYTNGKLIAPDLSNHKAIIDVAELPTENINEEAFYRLLTGTFYYRGTPQADWTCYVVESLTDEGVPVTTDMIHVSLYYAIDTGTVSGYINSALSGAVGVPVGWYPVEALAQAFGLGWGGIIWSELDDTLDGANRLLLSYSLYQYKNKWENISKKIGWAGEGTGAEIFNSLTNSATGNTSHAEGFHAYANGEASHTEGWYTVANGDYQHAQGRLNIEDTENKYAHIVGNGDIDLGTRSNAHTIDWQGNGWFAGTIKVGGTGQDDENAKELATKEYVDSKGGGSADNVALMVTVSTDYPTTMSAIVTAIQEAGGDISKLTFVTLQGYLNYNLAMSFAWRGGNYYKVDCIDLTNMAKIYNASTDNSVYDATSMRIEEFLDAGRPEEKEEMPQIRFTSANGNAQENSTFYVDEENPLKLTVEIVGGGALQVGDQLQVCKQKRFDGCRANGYKRKYKLQRFVEYVVTEEDLNKRFLTVNIVPNQLKVMHGLFRDGKEASLSPLYLRIRRSKGDMQNNDSGQTVDATFSNTVTVWKSYHRSNHAIRIY